MFSRAPSCSLGPQRREFWGRSVLESFILLGTGLSRSLSEFLNSLIGSSTQEEVS